jgi:thioesterase domain-containing protein
VSAAPPGRSPLVAIQPAGDRPPLVCVHPLSGHATCYRGLSDSLGPEQPLFALEAIGVDGVEPPLERIEEMAARYLDAVRARQPRGPYALAGWSFGGLIALELAQELARRGEETRLLVIDASLPEPTESGESESVDEETAALRILVRAFESRMSGGGPAEPRALPGGDDRLAALLEQARQHGLAADIGVEQVRPMLRVMGAHVRARRAYRPVRYPGAITLLRTAEPRSLWPDDPTLGWGTIAAGGVDLLPVPGPHQRLLDQPSLAVVAEHVRAWLRR